jgi:hypothetical protein
VLDGPVSNTDGFLLRDTYVCSSHLNRPIVQTALHSIFQNLTSGKKSFQNLIQFSHGINVIGAPVSITNGFLQRDTCISSP